MKIKKVEIQAFKSYLERHDGTFDFTIDSGDGSQEIADFVSIYAPNGFGKTSFYDAIDYAVTNNISRYIRDNDLTKKNKEHGRTLNKQGKKQYILRNREADSYDENLKTEVLVETSAELFKSKYKKPNNNYMDYRFDLKESRNRYFEAVLLSQESIDAFIRETSPDIRYQKFVEKNSELGRFEETRKQLSCMCKSIDSAKNSYNSQKKQKEIELKKIDSMESPFDAANQLVNKLKGEGIAIDSFELPFTNIEKQKILDQTIIGINQLKQKRSLFENDSEQMQVFIRDIRNSQIIVKEFHLINTQLEKVKATLKNIDTINNIEKQNSNITNTLTKNTGEVGELKSYLTQVIDFTVCNKKQQENNNRLTEQKRLQIELQSTLSSYQATLSSLRGKTFQVEQDIEKYSNVQLEAPMLFEEQRKLQSELLRFEQEKKQLEIDKPILQELEVNEKQYLQFLKNIDINNSIEEAQFNPQVKYFCNSYTSNKRMLNDVKLEIEGLKGELLTVQSQSKAVSELIDKASEIIAQTQQKECPLCQQPYRNFEQLKQQIVANPALTHSEQKLVRKVQERQLKENEYNKAIKETLAGYTSLKQSLIQGQESKINNTRAQQQELLEQINSTTQLIRINQQQILTLAEKTQHKTETQYIADITEKTFELEKSLQELALEIQTVEKQKRVISGQVSSIEIGLKESTEELYSSIMELKKFSFYPYYNKQFSNSVIDEEPIRIRILTFIDGLEENIESLKTTRQENIQKINDLKSTIPSELFALTSSQLQELRIDLEMKSSKYNQGLHEFNNTLTKLDSAFPCGDSQWITLEELGQTHVEQFRHKIEYTQSLLADISLLNHFANESINYCNRLQFKEEIKEFEVLITRNQEIYNDLSSDLEVVNKYIQQSTDAYFKTELINQIYCSIDPHPEYKCIKFNCHIPDVGKPELNISVVNEANSDIISPNLNFSSAQINVLSLSIFLARALTTNDDAGNPVNCIFIDDPIQSLDSINVLSLIDLFRNLSCRFGKQLIVSTHDENFHELLKKKIPKNIFRAKYLRLGSYGKVAYD